MNYLGYMTRDFMRRFMFGWCGKEIDLIPILKASPVLGNTTLRSAAHSQYADMFCWSTPRRCRLRPVRPGLRLGRSAGGGSIRTLLLLLLVSQGRRNVSNYGGARYKRTTFDCFFPLFRLRQNFGGAIGPWVPTPLLSCSLIVLTE